MLIHKTMKMPTSCLSCWIAPTCEVWVREKSKYKGYDNRLENCPLEPVKHGHWDGKGFESVRCSVCGITVDAINGIPWANIGFKFCPHCGAKMDEVTEDDTVRTV